MKSHTKKVDVFINTITQYSPRLLQHNICTAHALNQMREKNHFFPYHLQFLITICWIYETAPNLVPFIAIFNLGIKRSYLALNHGSRVDGIT
jgi:hypothetical protein